MGASGKLHRLSALQVAREVDPGYYADGGGLHLQITLSGSRSWIFRYQLAKRSREMGLGPLSSISLAEARAEAARCRKLLSEVVDLIDARRADRERAAQASLDVLSCLAIGRARYESVTGSCDALQRLAHAYRQMVARRPGQQLERGLLERWAQACEQGRGDQVANAIRTWLDGDEGDGVDARYDD